METDLLILAAADELSSVGGVPLPLMGGMIALATAIITAVIGGLVKKFRTPADDREDRVVVLDASDRLIERFEKLLKDSDEKHGKEIAELAGEVKTLRQELEAVKQERTGLLGALMDIVRIARRHGGEAADVEIRAVSLPPGVLIH